MQHTSSTIGERFKKAREQLGLKQKEIAKQLDVSPSHISGIESGKKTPSDRLVELFCLKFKISRTWLLFGGENIQIVNDDSRQELKAGNFEVNIDEAYETSTGYVIRYMKLLKYFCVAGDLNKCFDCIINDSALEIVLNYIVQCFLRCKEENEDFGKKYVDTIIDTMPGFKEFYQKYIGNKSNKLAYYLNHKPYIWTVAEKVEKMIDPQENTLFQYSRADLLLAEEDLLLCNISGISELIE